MQERTWHKDNMFMAPREKNWPAKERCKVVQMNEKGPKAKRANAMRG